MNEINKMKQKKNANGITLLALVVTVIVLLILAGVSISAIVGIDGIISRAGNASEKTTEGRGKEKIELALGEYQMKNTEESLTEFFKSKDWCKNATENEDKTIEVTIDEGSYEVSQDGEVKRLAPNDDKTPGELAGSGTEQDPFRIESIEDLVVFSIMTNGGNTELGLKKDNFSNKYVTLERTLNFESDVSYKDSTTTKYGDLNKDEKVEDIKTELTKKDEGCIGFTPIYLFLGTFDGKGNVIRNIYEHDNNKKKLGLFLTGQGTIKNLSLSGNIIGTTHSGGIACGMTYISNCINYANVTGGNMVAGICRRESEG